MTRTRLAYGIDAFGLIGIYAVASLIVRSSLFVTQPEVMSTAITVDLIVTAALLHYVVGVRHAGLPKWTVAPVAAMGGVAATLLIPGGESLGLAAGLLVMVELGVSGFALWRLGALVKDGRAARASGADVFEALEAGLAESLESKLLAAAVVTELRLMGLGLFGVFRRTPTIDGAFTMHKLPGYYAVAGVLIGLSFVEIPVVHLLLQVVHPVPAWIVTVLSIYGLIWIWGDVQAMRLHPTVVEGDALKLRVGLRWRATILLADIAAIERVTEPEAVDVVVLGAPTLALVLRRPVTVKGPFGITRTGTRISLQIDEPEAFAAAIGSPIA